MVTSSRFPGASAVFLFGDLNLCAVCQLVDDVEINAGTGTECNDESLQYTDCAVEKCHKVFPPLFAPQVAGDNEKALFLQRMCTCKKRAWK
jgi:hypothetical protein